MQRIDTSCTATTAVGAGAAIVGAALIGYAASSFFLKEIKNENSRPFTGRELFSAVVKKMGAGNVNRGTVKNYVSEHFESNVHIDRKENVFELAGEIVEICQHEKNPITKDRLIEIVHRICREQRLKKQQMQNQMPRSEIAVFAAGNQLAEEIYISNLHRYGDLAIEYLRKVFL